MSDEHFFADADGVHICPIQRRPMQHRWNAQKVKDWVGTPWEMMPEKTELMEPTFPRRFTTLAVEQKHCHLCGCKSCHALLGGQGNGRGGEGCEASQLECNDKGDPFGNSNSEWCIVKFE